MDIEERIRQLEKRVSALENNFSLQDSFSAPLSNTAHLQKILTSPTFSKQTLKQALAFGISCGVLAGVVSLRLNMPLEFIPTAGTVAFLVVLTASTLDTRSLIHSLATSKRAKADEMILYINKGGSSVSRNAAQRLFLDGSIDKNRLKIFARKVLNQNASLSFGVWAGKNKLFTRGEFESIRSELVMGGYARDVRGSGGMKLEKEGRELLQSIMNA